MGRKGKTYALVAILVVGIGMLAVGVHYLQSPPETTYVESYIPDPPYSPPRIPIFDGYYDGYNGRDPNPSSHFTYEQRQRYYDEYLEGLNDRLEDLESQLEDYGD